MNTGKINRNFFAAPCHTYQVNSVSSKRVKLVKMCHEISSKVSTIENIQKKYKRKKKNRDINVISKLPTIEGSIPMEFDFENQRCFFIGLPDIESIYSKIPQGSFHYNVNQTLKIIDSKIGAMLPDTFTLVPRKHVLYSLGGSKTFLTLKRVHDNTNKNGNSNTRGKKKTPVSTDSKTTYTTLGPYPNRFGTGYNVSYGSLDEKTRNGIFHIMKQIEYTTNRYCMSFHTNGIKMARKYIEWPTFENVNNEKTDYFSNIAIGKNVFLPVHKDEDAYYSVTFVFANMKVEYNSDILAYFCFPKKGVAVALRQGDILIFNPLEPHCVSSKCVDYDIMCSSVYLKSKLVGGNDNSKQFTDKEILLHDSLLSNY